MHAILIAPHLLSNLTGLIETRTVAVLFVTLREGQQQQQTDKMVYGMTEYNPVLCCILLPYCYCCNYTLPLYITTRSAIIAYKRGCNTEMMAY